MKNLLAVIVLTVILFTGCADETTIFDQQSLGKELVLEESTTVLSNGISNDSNGILDIYFENEISAKNGGLSLGTTSDFHLNLVGQVSSPNFAGSSNLAATHVAYQDQFAYVSYNTIGETFAGAVDVIDLSDPLSPVLTSRMYMYNRDANVILYDNDHLYVLGGVNTEMVLEATGESFIAKIGVNDGVIDLNNVSYFYQQGNTATGITKMGNSYYVSSGIDGSIAKYDGNAFLKSNEVAFDDLRSVSSENGKLAILDGATGITIMDGELNEVMKINTSSNFVEDAKRTIAMTADQVIVAEGTQGAGVYNLNSGALEEFLPILVDPENIASSDKVTNAVAINGDATLMANGGAGLAIKVTNDIVDLMGVVELNGSINYVVSDGDYIFAASGRSGLQIINKIRANQSFEDPVISVNYKILNENLVPGWETTASDNKIEIWTSGFLDVTSFEGNQHVELNANRIGALYQIFYLKPGSVIDWSVRHRGRNGTDEALVRIGASLTSATTEATMLSPNTSWILYSGTYTVPLGQTNTYFIFESTTNSSIGNFIDDVQINVTSIPKG